VQITELRGLFGQVQQQLVSMGQNVSSAVQSFQATQEQMRQDVRVMAEKLTSIDLLQHEQREHSTGIERAHEQLERFIAEARQQRSEDRAEEYKYRADRAAEDEKTRSKIMRISSFALGVSACVSIVVSLVVYIYVSDKSNNQRDFDGLKEKITVQDKEDDLRLDRVEAVLSQMCAEQKRDCRFR
jgi:hypothetical protein